MDPRLQQGIEKVDASYKRRNGEQAKIWAGFDEEAAALTGIVSREFNRVLGEIDLSEKINNVKRKVVIKDFNVDYVPQWKYFDIKIKDWEVDIDGESFSDRNGRPYFYCAHSYLKKVIGFSDEVDSRIPDFKRDFNVQNISYACKCGSDHK